MLYKGNIVFLRTPKKKSSEGGEILFNAHPARALTQNRFTRPLCFHPQETSNASGNTDRDYPAVQSYWPALESMPFLGEVNCTPLPPELVQAFESILLVPHCTIPPLPYPTASSYTNCHVQLSAWPKKKA